ncbi:MAG: hypothetical protein LBT24_04725, partial [Tannerella sp.]|nr:hypothetical protein [Tannerella sp.]
MQNKISIFKRLSFSDNDINNDITRTTLSFPDNNDLSDQLGTTFYYGKSEQVKTRFYWIKADGLSPESIKIIHKRLWNENRADLLFLENETTCQVDIK